MKASCLKLNRNNTKEELLDYLPFGTIRIDQKAGSYSDQRKFAGMEHDNDTGLSYANARYYDSNTGRFVSQDPAFLLIGDKKKFEGKYDCTLQSHLTDPQNLNSYSYVNNNPLKYTDPDGEIIPLLIAGAAAVWAITEVALSAYDIYSAGKTVANPNASWTDKGISVAGVGIGLIAPGGGYGKVGQEALQSLSKSNKILSAGQRQVISQTIQNQKLKNIFNSLYKGSDTLPGGTAGAIKYEFTTGKLMSPTGHLYKGQVSINGLNKIIQNSNVSKSDKSIAQTLLNQLKNAINGK